MHRGMRGAALLAALIAAAAFLLTAGTAGAYTTASGYAASDFVTGFANQGPYRVGPVGLAWDATNHLYVAGYHDGIVYKFGAAGGVADAAHALNVGHAYPVDDITGLAFSKTGRLYLARQAYGQVVEIDPATGLTLRPVAPAPCATGLATDPLSGDLIVTNPCPGPPTRIVNPDGALPVPQVVSYPYWADGITFAPDGTIWSTYGGTYLVRGDSTASPSWNTGAGLHIVASISTLDGTAVSADPAHPGVFAVTNNGQVVRFDPTTNTQTVIFSGGSRGDFSTVGPDGCLYITQTDRIVKITNADGSCSWSPTTALPTITLAPATQSHHVGETASLTATLANVTSPVGTTLAVTVTGANPQTTTATVTSAGTAAISLTAVNAGTDHVTVSGTLNSQPVSSNTVDVTWLPPLDSTPPVIVPTITGPAGDNGWHTGDTTVTWSVTDPETAIASTTGCGPTTLSGYHAGETLTCSATNAAGLSASESVTVKIDDTPPLVTPTVTGTLGGNGWYTSPVTVSWTTSDDESGIAVDCQAATYSSSATSTCTARNGAGLETTATQSFRIDQVAPTVTFSPNGGVYDVNQTVSIACTAADDLSGVASTTCADVHGTAWSLGVGTHTLSASATDNAGNVGNGTGSFTVVATADGVCALVQQWVSNAGIANSLCAKLRAAAAARARGQNGTADNVLAAFRNELAAQRGKALTAAHADTLTTLSWSL